MAQRKVTHSKKDSDGDILGLKGPWGDDTSRNIISHIENGVHSYYVNETGSATDVRVVKEGSKKYLRTTADASSKNNLDNLPGY